MPHIDDGLLHAHLDGALPALAAAGALPDGMQTSDVIAHFDQCADCRSRLEAEREVRARAGLVLRDATPMHIHTPPLATAPAVRRTAPSWLSLAWAASVIVAVGAGWWGSEVWRMSGSVPAELSSVPGSATDADTRHAAGAATTEGAAPTAEPAARSADPGDATPATPARDLPAAAPLAGGAVSQRAVGQQAGDQQPVGAAAAPRPAGPAPAYAAAAPPPTHPDAAPQPPLPAPQAAAADVVAREASEADASARPPLGEPAARSEAAPRALATLTPGGPPVPGARNPAVQPRSAMPPPGRVNALAPAAPDARTRVAAEAASPAIMENAITELTPERAAANAWRARADRLLESERAGDLLWETASGDATAAPAFLIADAAITAHLVAVMPGVSHLVRLHQQLETGEAVELLMWREVAVSLESLVVTSTGERRAAAAGAANANKASAEPEAAGSTGSALTTLAVRRLADDRQEVVLRDAVSGTFIVVRARMTGETLTGLAARLSRTAARAP